MLNSKEKKELRELQEKYILAKAKHEVIAEMTEENKLKVLKNNRFYDEDGNRVLRYDYHIADSDYHRFLQLWFEENKKSGLPVSEPNKVPGYEAYKNLKDIEEKLLKFQLKILPEDIKEPIRKAQRHWKYRTKCLELILLLDV